MALRLEYFGETSVPVEVEGLTTNWARDKSLAEIEKFEIFEGNRKIPLAEMFRISGDPADGQHDWVGNLAGVHWIAAHMTSGRVEIHGPAGRHIGSQMRGGDIQVHGDAGGWVGAEMRGGLIHVHGNAGHLVGAAYRGSAKGMTGGMLLVDGNVGNELGHTLRRGVIAVRGGAGDMIGFNMIAGTILVFGEAGIRPGAGMRRGTIGLFGSNPPPLLPSFRRSATYDPQFLRVLLREIRQRGFVLEDAQIPREIQLCHGDLVSVGRGEILMRPAVAV